MYKRFEKLLNENKITSYKVGKDTGIASATFSDWKNGRSVPKQDKLIKIAEYFDVSIDWLMGNSDTRKMINTTKWDDETLEMMEEVHKNPELRMLFKATKNLSPEDIKKTVEMIKIFKGGDDD